MRLYGFMQDEKWYEDVGHILIGLVPFWGWWREWRQWPPGSDLDPPVVIWDDRTYSWLEEEPANVEKAGAVDGAQVYYPANRVADSYRDFLGYAIGGAIRTVGLVVWGMM